MQQLIKRRESLLTRLVAAGNFIKGSITCVCGTCGRSHCVCTTKSTTKAYRLTYKDGRQKTQIVYIPKNRLPEMRRLTANYARVRVLVQQIISTFLWAYHMSKRSAYRRTSTFSPIKRLCTEYVLCCTRTVLLGPTRG